MKNKISKEYNPQLRFLNFMVALFVGVFLFNCTYLLSTDFNMCINNMFFLAVYACPVVFVTLKWLYKVLLVEENKK